MAIGEILTEMSQVLSGAYPSFVHRDGEMESDYLPVFAFHTLEPNDFAAKLAYLAGNGYSTVTLDEADAWLTGRGTLPSRAVALTIDDGRLTTWTVGYPLLRRFGLRATAFVIPGYLGEGPARPLPDDPLSLAVDERSDMQSALRWDEARALDASGVVRIESHTMLHRKVVVDDRLEGFLTPATSVPPFELPLSPDAEQGWTADHRRERMGTPLFRAAPVLMVEEARPVRAAVAAACEAAARDAGPDAFREPGWSRRVARALRGAGSPLDAPVPVLECQRWELRVSRRRLEDALGRPVRHFCYPRGRGAPHTATLVRDAGYHTACWSFLPARDTNRPGADALRLGRLKHDFIYRLPGDGTRPLHDILRLKVARRLRGDTGY
jgi:peptidoglycan/xylan/chitin deacetylase (PgdA/CDA1 family)